MKQLHINIVKGQHLSLLTLGIFVAMTTYKICSQILFPLFLHKVIISARSKIAGPMSSIDTLDTICTVYMCMVHVVQASERNAWVNDYQIQGTTAH